MSDNPSTTATNIIKIPLQRDESGKPVVYIDPALFSPPEKKPEAPKPTTKAPSKSVLTATPTPEQIFAAAKQVILYQEDALKAFSTVLYYHLEAMRQHQYYQMGDSFFQCLLDSDNKTMAAKQYAQAPIFLTGKTGSGKTHLIKQLCKLYDVNFLAINSSSLSNAGYKGFTLADAGSQLLASANQDKTKAEFSIVFFDEFDKLFLNTGETHIGAYQRQLITEILTLIEGTTPFPVRDEEGFDSSKMLFVLGGSFNMHHANKKANIGFMGEKVPQHRPDNHLKLTDFGLPDELAGRIGKIIAMQDIDEALMKQILLKSPSSPFVGFEAKLSMVDCTVTIEDEALTALVVKQSEAIQKFGVRGLYQGFNELPQLVDILYDAPNSPKTHYIILATGFEAYQDLEEARLAAEAHIQAYDLYDEIPF